ncbi:DUF1471 domain-containing protein [Rahnella bonaserana]|uniref:DUF1471 domain-containing protein n=1 Tax=Rahnella bonaserana TaxID=2816248 RepID=UPI0024C4001E|nr:DUF1471 domain-containing protein [Rahnella bonaserana]WHZ42374.1 DUF1471 domain-containing protein [Rahnella bonaserana]
MKGLVNDVLSIFYPKSVTPTACREAISRCDNPLRIKKALDAGAVGYHITHVESHKPGKEEQHVMAATATFYHINHKVAYD